MSLINDALKRASQTAPSSLPAAEKVQEAPATPVVARKSPALWQLFIFPVLSLALLGGAGWYFLWNSEIASLRLNETELKVEGRQFPETTSGQASAAVPKPAAASQAGIEKPGLQGTASLKTEERILQTSNETGTALAPNPPPAPDFRLQGIFYRPSRPLAMINGKTVGVGDRISSGKVLSIRQDSVSVLAEGQTKVLTLPSNN
ncbi:MAG TPA: hypothetical protein VMZ27_07155 [Candidatus Saccharimonadales bacterium]|nr:hypothetical protein [Candidatus Saccharimonadales bacterium]